MKDMLQGELENHFRPEFINRVDEIIVFRKLGHEDMVQIVDLEVAKLAQRLEAKGLTLELAQEAKDFLIERGTDEKFGARPLRRAIEHYVEDPLSEDMLRDRYAGKNRVVVSVKQPPTEDDLPVLAFEGVYTEPETTETGEAIGAGAGDGVDAT